ncbi:hypothetical protein MMC07_003181 [Pseudocyphellaria aurata]|nr:hypothetical protein [Pseudocyphellaria aurata]
MPQNHYTLFPHTLPAGPPPSGPFEVDLTRLRKEFLQLQSRAHPDLHQGTSKSRAEGMSALINDAYKTLQHPLLRAQYILSLRGIEIADDEGTPGGQEVDQGLLMDVLKVREAIEEAETEEDMKALEAENGSRIGKCVGQLEDYFARDDLQGAREEVGRLRYWCAIQETLKG